MILGCALRGRRVEGGNEEERGGPRRVGDSSGCWHWPPAGGRVWRRCHATGEGDGARAAGRWDRATTGPGGQRLGAGGVRGSGAVQHEMLTSGSSSTVPGWPGFKPDSNRLKQFKMVQTDSKSPKFWLTQKMLSCALKIRDKI
jgi:hypothetical protein